MKKTACIIVLFNPAIDNLQAQLESLSKQIGHVVAVNNGMSENSLETLLELHACHYIKNPQNLGVATAQNIGIKWALENGYEHVLLMDDDSVPQSNMVETLLQAEKKLLHLGIKVAAVGPNFFDLRKTETADKSEEEWTKTSMLISSGMLLRKEVINDVGLMNDWLFIDCVDDDWCFRALAKGYKIFRVNNAMMQHRLGEVKKLFFDKLAFHYHRPFRYYYRFRNYIYLLKQSYVAFPLKLGCIRAMTKLLIKIIFLPHKTAYWQNTWRGIIAGVKSGKQ